MSEAVIGIDKETKDELENLKGKGKTFDRVIRELIEFWKKDHGKDE